MALIKFFLDAATSVDADPDKIQSPAFQTVIDQFPHFAFHLTDVEVTLHKVEAETSKQFAAVLSRTCSTTLCTFNSSFICTWLPCSGSQSDHSTRTSLDCLWSCSPSFSSAPQSSIQSDSFISCPCSTLLPFSSCLKSWFEWNEG